jgi:hypothetical protein
MPVVPHDVTTGSLFGVPAPSTSIAQTPPGMMQ